MVRARGRQNARIVVVNGPLPKQYDHSNTLAAAQPADPAEALARATDDDTIQVTVTPDVLPEAKPAVLAMPPVKPVMARHVGPARRGTFTAVGSEAEVLRGREAWLRSLDRKYGIVR
jgi:hypothetical protein